MEKAERKLKVAVLGTLPPMKALSSYCFEFAKALCDFCEVSFISFAKIYPSFLYPGGRDQVDRTYPELHNSALGVKRRLTWHNPLSWILEGLSTKGELLHAQWWSLPLFPIFFTICSCFKLKGKPVVITVHNVLPHEKSIFFLKLSALLFAIGDHFIVHSKICRRQMIEHYGIPYEKISVIAHGSLDFHKRVKVDATSLRSEMGFSTDEKIILLFGAVRPYKGIDLALEAMPKILEQVPETRLVIAGKLWIDWSPYRDLIESLNIMDRVTTFLEYIPSEDVHKFFETADLCIFPYRNFDSQSGAAATAVSFRKPVIVSAVGGLPELVPDERFVVPPNDPSAVAEVAVACLRTPELRKSFDLGMDKVSKSLDWKDIAKKTSDIYDNLTQNRMQPIRK